MGKTKEELLQIARTSEVALANHMAMVCLSLIDAFIGLAYLSEGMNGNRTAGYTALVLALAFIPVIVGWILYKMDNDSPFVKHIVGLCFPVLYTYILFTAKNPLVFVYAIPMLIIVTLYLDPQFLTMEGVGVIILNIIDVVRYFVKGVEQDRKVMLQVQLIIMIMIAIYIIMTTNVSLRYQEINSARITLEKDKTTDVLNKILEVSGSMTDDISKVVGEMNTLSNSVDATLEAMSDVQAGAAETANSVQDQLSQTEEITNYAGAVEDAAEIIKSNLKDTLTAIEAGKDCMKEMASISAESVKTSEKVTEALEGFKATANQMNQITDLINSVAKKTSLLSLNASIEAARAGEAGKGFAVVATEISQLAGQTSAATKNIGDLISEITEQLGVMVSAVNGMVEDNAKQTEAANRTDEAFASIVTNIDEISSQAEVLVKSIDELSEANKLIVETVTTISAISEQVSAHSNQTFESSQQNQKIVKTVGELVEALNSEAQVLSETSGI